MEFNLAEVFTAVAAAVPDRDCIVFGDRRLTFAEVDDRTARLARVLHEWGLGAHTERSALAGHQSGQSHLALYLTNANEYVEDVASTGLGSPRSTSTTATSTNWCTCSTTRTPRR